MSFKSWKAEHYPVDAKTLSDSGAPLIDLVDHCIKKWEGLRPEVLRKHRMMMIHDALVNRRLKGESLNMSSSEILVSSNTSTKAFIMIDDTSCALCRRFDDDDPDYDPVCDGCPLNDVRGAECTTRKGGTPSPWEMWSSCRDPELMIEWLYKARQMLAKKAEKADHAL